MKLFKPRYTKWVPFGNYNYGTAEYIVFVRKHFKTGMMQFKTKRIHDWWKGKDLFVPVYLIDVKQAWEEIKGL